MGGAFSNLPIKPSKESIEKHAESLKEKLPQNQLGEDMYYRIMHIMKSYESLESSDEFQDFYNFFRTIVVDEFNSNVFEQLDSYLIKLESSFLVGDLLGELDLSGIVDKASGWANSLSRDIKKSLRSRMNEVEGKDAGETKTKINEHYLAVLKYPQDEESIRKIFEQSIAIVDGKYNLLDAHPFHLIHIAIEIGVPMDFKFEVSDYDKKYKKTRSQALKLIYYDVCDFDKGCNKKNPSEEEVRILYMNSDAGGDDFEEYLNEMRSPYFEKKGYSTTIDLQTLIALEKHRLLTNVNISTDPQTEAFHYDDEFHLLYLNGLNVQRKKSDHVGTNLEGKKIYYGDLLKSVKADLLNIGVETKKYMGYNMGLGTIGDFGHGEQDLLAKSHRYIQQSMNTCFGIHAASALLGSNALSKKEKIKYAGIIFDNIFDLYISEVTRSENLKSKIVIIGHSLQLYLQHESYFNKEQKRFFRLMISELPDLMNEIEKEEDEDSIVPALTHLYEALELLEGKTL